MKPNGVSKQVARSIKDSLPDKWDGPKSGLGE